MLESLSLSSSSLSSSSTHLHQHTLPESFSFPLQCSFPLKPNSKLLSSSFRARAKAKELILRNPTISVEKGKYSYEVGSLINTLSSLPPRGSIARSLEPYKNKLSMNDFALVFKEFAQRGDWQRSLRLFKYIQRHIWCKPNEHIYTILIGTLGREGLLEKCRDVFEEMPNHNVPRSVFSYTALINAYGRNGDYETALQLLARMKKEKVPPSVLTYNTLINSCARGGLDWEELLGLFAEMRHEGVQPDIVTYNTLLCACATRDLGDEAEKLFRTMIDSGVSPDLTTYVYMVDTFGKLGRLRKVAELLKEMEDGGQLPDISAYNVLLEAYAKTGSISDAMDVFRQFQVAGCSPNATTYSILLNLYGSQGRYDDVRELFIEMKVSNTQPDATTYNILLQVFGEGGYFKEVVTLFHDMLEENVEPNMETYEGLIFACGKGGLHEDAKNILLHMNENRLLPSPKVYTGVIEAYGLASLYEEAIVTFNTMKEAGSVPMAETYNSLIHTFARGGLYKELEGVLSMMEDSGISEDRDTFNGLIEGFTHAGKFEEAAKVFVAMEKSGSDRDETTLEAVLGLYYFAGLVDQCEVQLQEMKEQGLVPSTLCYCMMLSVYAKNDRLDEAYDVLDEMINSHGSNINLIIGQMIRGYLDDESNWQMVEYVFDKLTSEGRGFGMRFYNVLLEALWCLGQRERAARVLKEAAKRDIFPELHRKNKLIWSLDVHRMWPGSACAALLVWINDMHQTFRDGGDLPQIATIVVVRGIMEKTSTAQNFPVAKAVYSFLEDNISPSFNYSKWSKGRIVCQRSQLKKFLSENRGEIIIEPSNTHLPPASTRFTSTGSISNNKDVGRSIGGETSRTVKRRESDLVVSRAVV